MANPVYIGRIVMNDTILVDGEYFLRNHQYLYTEKRLETLSVRIDGIKPPVHKIIHYVVPVEDTDYLIPDIVCVEYDKEIPEAYQDKIKYYRDSLVDTSDWRAVVKEMAGISIDNRTAPSVDLRAYNSVKDDIDRTVHEDIQDQGSGI